MTTLHELFADLPVNLPAQARDLSIHSLSEDSRTTPPGSLFIARQGDTTDAVQHIPQAQHNGAIAALCAHDATPPPGITIPLLTTTNLPRTTATIAERFFDNPSQSLCCVAITGTNGKTTVASLTQQLLYSLDIPTGCIGSISIDASNNPQPASLTTPFAIDISRALARMRNNNYRAAVMETSSIALHQQRCAAIDFDIAILTNFTGDHLDYHTSMDDYAACKALLFESLDPDDIAIVNIDDPHWQSIASNTRAKLLRCSAQPDAPADCAVQIKHASIRSTQLSLTGPWGTLDTTVPLLGQHNAMNLLQACAAAHSVCQRLDINPTTQQWLAALAACTPPVGRLEPVIVLPAQDIHVFVDYAHTDDALANVLRTLNNLKPSSSQLLCLFGCGGDRDPSKRPRMGRVASQLADRVILTSDNPRTENPRAILDDIAAGIDDLATTTIEPDRARALQLAISSAQPGDLLLIAGKGHETYQLLSDPSGEIRRIDFSDQQHARNALLKRAEHITA